jgi:hypothetical protein
MCHQRPAALSSLLAKIAPSSSSISWRHAAHVDACMLHDKCVADWCLHAVTIPCLLQHSPGQLPGPEPGLCMLLQARSSLAPPWWSPTSARAPTATCCTAPWAASPAPAPTWCTASRAPRRTWWCSPASPPPSSLACASAPLQPCLSHVGCTPLQLLVMWTTVPSTTRQRIAPRLTLLFMPWRIRRVMGCAFITVQQCVRQIMPSCGHRVLLAPLQDLCL